MRSFVELVFPTSCAGCQRPSVIACPACLAGLTVDPWLAWPQPSPRGLPPPYAAAPYDGQVRRLLLAFKEEGCVGLRRPLARAMARALIAALGPHERVRIVPVPSSAASRRRRGDDIVRALARTAAADLRRLGLDAAVVPALRHNRRVRDSAGLTAAQRAGNLADAFSVLPHRAGALAGVPVVLVDDLVTTGVTLAECAAALRRVGVEVRACATVAATQRQRVVGPG